MRALARLCGGRISCNLECGDHPPWQLTRLECHVSGFNGLYTSRLLKVFIDVEKDDSFG